MERWKRYLITGMAVLAVGCAQQGVDHDDDAPPADVRDAGRAESPATADPAASPNADSLLPPLPGYRTDDDAEQGEVESSLDHGSVLYEQVRRRIVLDEQDFTSGVVTVITFRPDSGSAARILDHIYGDAPRTSVTVEGEEMIRIETGSFPVVAWVGRGFVVTFQRGQERSAEWLDDLVRATVRAVVSGEG